MGELLLPLSTAVEYTTNTSSMVINISMMNPPNGVVFGLIPFTPSEMSCSETWNKIAAPEVSSKIGHVSMFCKWMDLLSYYRSQNLNNNIQKTFDQRQFSPC